jgi:chemotaxis protein MotA
MEKSTLAGLGAGILLIYGSIFMGAGWMTFFDPASLMLVIGGASAGMMVQFTFGELKTIPQVFKDFFSFVRPEYASYIDTFGELSKVARREGLLALDRQLEEIDDSFLKFGLEMAVDGIDEREINDPMIQNANTEMKHHVFAASFFNAIGAACPAFGMIGTLIGLIQMMGNLEDPSQIGAGMAVALVTTFYGSLLANLVFLPFAQKKKAQISELNHSREIVRTGVMGIVRGDSPSMIQKRLQLYLTDQDLGAAAAEAVEVT